MSFTTVRGQTIGFNSCDFIKFLNIANFQYAFHVWGKHILSCNDTNLSFTFFYFCFRNPTFFHSGYIVKPSQPSSIYGALPFTSNPKFHKIFCKKIATPTVNSSLENDKHFLQNQMLTKFLGRQS